jgi:hypothetical protein
MAIISISLRDFEKNWLKNQQISPSKLFQEHIFTLMNPDNTGNSIDLIKKIDRMRQIISIYAEICERHNLTEEVMQKMFNGKENLNKLTPRKGNL